MTQIRQDDLLKIIDSRINSEPADIEPYGSEWFEYAYFKLAKRLVLRHKVKIDMNGFGSCEECSRVAYYNVPWPCLSVEDVMEEMYGN